MSELRRIPSAHDWAALRNIFDGMGGILGEHAEATPLIEEALALPLPPGRSLPDAEWALAQLIVSRDRARAVTLARHARAGFVEDKGRGDARVAQIDAWIRR
jgi:hypothetical protein